MIWLAWALRAAAGPEDALGPAARELWDDAAALERAGRPREAAARYRAVRTVDPAFEHATVALARVLAESGDLAAAEAECRALPWSADAVELLGDLLLRQSRPREAAEAYHRLVDLRPEWPGARLLEARAAAPVDPPRAARLVRDWLAFSERDPERDPVVEVTREVVDALRSTGRREDAAALLDEVLGVTPSAADALAELRVRIDVDLEARARAEASDTPLDGASREALVGARRRFAAGDADGARRVLEVLVVEAPRSADAWSALSEVREAQGDLAGAEQAASEAVRLDPADADRQARVGDLLTRAFAGRYDAEAAQAYARAARRRPDDARLWALRAEAERRAGHWASSVAAWSRVAALRPDDPDARRALEGATRARRDLLPAPPSGRPEEVPEAAWWAYQRASAWRERPEAFALDEALAELGYVAESAPGFAPAAMLEAEIRTDRGELAAAEALYGKVLARSPEDAEALARLAGLAERAGDPARAAGLWDRAAAAGDPRALLARAEALAATARWWRAHEPLAAVLDRVSTGDVFEQATALDAALRRRTRAAGALGAGLVVAVPLVPVAIRRRRRAGVDLDALVARSPARGREVAARVAAIDHEVVKHHFGLVDAVADALVAGDRADASFAADRWFGTAGDGGAIGRLRRSVQELEAIGRAEGIRVNARWRDRRLGPLLAAAEALAALEGPLRRGDAEVSGRLRALGPALGPDAHAALLAFVDSLGTLAVDAAVLASLHARAAAEFPGRPVAPPDLRAPTPARIRMFRAEFEDVIVNLVRNAIQATPADEAARIGLHLSREEDPVTLLERAVIRVCDQAPGSLTTATLRSRHVSRGLGLAVDLAGRAGGSLRVEPASGYQKAVVLRVPAVPEAA